MTSAIFARTHNDSFESLRNTNSSSSFEPLIDVQSFFFKPSSSELAPSTRSHSYSKLFPDQSPPIDPAFISDLNHEDSSKASFEFPPCDPQSPTGFRVPLNETYRHLRSNETDILHLLYPVYREKTGSSIWFEPELSENHTTFPCKQSVSIEDICDQLPDFDPYEEMDFNQNSTNEPVLPLAPPASPLKSAIGNNPWPSFPKLTEQPTSLNSEQPRMSSGVETSSFQRPLVSKTVLQKRKSHEPVTGTLDNLKKFKLNKETPAPIDNTVPDYLFGFKAGLILRYIDNSINHRWGGLFKTKFSIAVTIYADYQNYLSKKQINSYAAKSSVVTKVFLMALSDIQTDNAVKAPKFFYLPSKGECRNRIDHLKQSMEEAADHLKTSVGKFLTSSLKRNKKIWNYEGAISLFSLYRQYAAWIKKEEIYHQLNQKDFKDSLCKWLPCLEFLDKTFTVPSREICIQSFLQMKAERLSKVFKNKVKLKT